MKEKLLKAVGSLGYNSVEAFCKDFSLEVRNIGELICNKGVQTSVFKYGDDQVIKIPKKNVVNKIFLGYDLSFDLSIVKKYLGKYIPNTEILTSRSGLKPTIVLQEFVHGEHVDLTIDSKDLASKFNSLVSDVESLYRKGFMLDIIGGESFYPFVLKYAQGGFRFKKSKPYFSNLMITGDGRVLVTDFKITSLKRQASVPFYKHLIFKIYAPLHFKFQKWFVGKFEAIIAYN